RPGQKPILLSAKFEQSADMCLDASNRNILVPDMKAGTLNAVPINIPGWEVDETPLAVKTELAFENVSWTGWAPENDKGQVTAFRPILLTHFGDGSNRLVVPQQEGIVHVIPNNGAANKSTVLLDLSSKVRYHDKQNEEGLLGLAIHPKFKTNGEFFV